LQEPIGNQTLTNLGRLL